MTLRADSGFYPARRPVLGHGADEPERAPGDRADRDGTLLDREADHRRHAVVEQVIADLKGGCGLAHLPSGRFARQRRLADSRQPGLQPGRWCVALISPRWRTITTATLRTRLLAAPARIVHTARRLHLRLPSRWPWEAEYQRLRDAISRLVT